METTTDYSKLSDVDLDTEIAKRLGWVIEERHAPGYGKLYEVVNTATGDKPNSWHGTEKLAWQDVPAYSTNLHEAWQLVKDIATILMDYGHGDTIGDHILWMENPEEIARFICIKWLETRQ